MQISKRKISKNLEKQVYNLLYQTIADLKSPKEAELFLKDIFSKTELSVMAKRLAAASLLAKAKNYQEIKDTLKISSATISRIANQMEKGEGFKIALRKIRADEWAEKWTRKIKKMLAMS
jgi:TrpR-related protein YerC/YecD